MIEINLLPEDMRKKEPRFKKIDLSGISVKNIPIIKVVTGAAIILVVVPILLFVLNTALDSNLVSLQKRYNALLPQKKEADLLKSRVEAAGKRVATIDALMTKRFSWARFLNDLSDSVTQGIWLTEVQYGEKRGEKSAPAVAQKLANGKMRTDKAKPVGFTMRYVAISGFASTMGEQGTALVGKFIKSLKENDSFYSHFSSIDLGSIKSEKLDAQEAMNFTITCLFKESEQL